MPGALPQLWPQVHDAFTGVDCILHAGDLHTTGVIDELEVIAPTWVSRGNGDEGIVDARLADHWCANFAGVQIGMTHRFPSPARAAPQRLAKKIDQFFALAPDVVIYGHTHQAEMHSDGQRLYINPGSPTLPNNQSTRLGNLALLEINEACVDARLLQISEQGVTPIDHQILRRSA